MTGSGVKISYMPYLALTQLTKLPVFSSLLQSTFVPLKDICDDLSWGWNAELSSLEGSGLSSQVKYILSQVLSGSHIGLSPGGVSNLVLLKTNSPCASPVASHCLYSCCGLTESPGLGWNCPRAWAVPITFHSCSCSVCTWLGDTHDLRMAQPSHVCSCH